MKIQKVEICTACGFESDKVYSYTYLCPLCGTRTPLETKSALKITDNNGNEKYICSKNE